MFSTQTYIERRKVLAQSVSSGMILLLGNEEMPMNYTDNTYHFRQDSTFLYYFGIDQPSLAGIIDADTGESMVFGDEASVEMIVWVGKLPTLSSLCDLVGIDNFFASDELGAVIGAALSKKREIHFLPPYRADNKIKLSGLLKESIAKIDNQVSLSLVKSVVAQREIKTAEEIKEIDRAVDISADMHLAAMKACKPGMRESEIAAKAAEIALAANGNISFPVIATINGQTLHNHYHGNIVKSGDLFLLDAGAETEMHYAGDLSSTFPVDPVFTARQKEIYQLCLNAHQSAVSMLQPGTSFREVHFAACRIIFDGLKSFGLTKGNTDDALKQGAHALFFPCGTGHMMGLDVHDMEDLGEQWVGYDGEPKSTQFGLKSLRLAKPLRPGHVVTIEPGIYFIPELIDQWKSENKHKAFLNYQEIEKYKDFSGLRNEEDYVLTKEGARRLGKALPLTIEGVEALRQE
jgi:Xaa-Pro aminopeptidase